MPSLLGAVSVVENRADGLRPTFPMLLERPPPTLPRAGAQLEQSRPGRAGTVSAEDGDSLDFGGHGATTRGRLCLQNRS